MAIKAVLILALVLCFSHYGMVEGGHRKLSLGEDLEIEKQLKLLNKPSLKTIETEHGDVYDCIDFYKQPAFDHPLLKNHTYHPKMRPSFLNQTRTDKQSQFGLPGGGCPVGTVPIRRTTQDDLIRAKALPDANKLYRTVIHTRDDPNRKYHGAGGVISLYQPQVTPTQYSSSQITLKNGLDTIQVGWTVNPGLYGDTKTRLFTFFQAGSLSCFNTRCPGFVIVNTEVPLDTILEPISVRGGRVTELPLFIQQDAANGNWWLQFGTHATQLGFWPQRIFNGLKDFATYADWGGEAYGGLQETPEIGTGHLPMGDAKYDSFCRLVRTIDENFKIVNAGFTQMFINSISYEVQDWGLQGQDGHIIVFGGPRK